MSAPRRVLLENSEDIASLEASLKSSGTDFFPTEVKRTREALEHRPCKHTLQISLTLGAAIQLLWNKGTSTDIVRNLNQAVVLVADSLYVFEYMVAPGESYNIQHSAGADRTLMLDIFESDIIDLN